MRRILVLDLDGTLVDTVPDLLACMNRLMATLGLAPFDAPALAAMVGDGVSALVARALAARARPPSQAALDAFRADYAAHAAIHSRPYPDVPETLRRLRAEGWRLALCTNKPEAPARALLAALDLLPLFDAIGAGDTFPTRKPDPAHLLATIAAANGTPATAIMVGDHRNDVQAAAGAAIPCIFARWGYGPPPMATGAAATAGRFAEIPTLAAQLIPTR